MVSTWPEDWRTGCVVFFTNARGNQICIGKSQADKQSSISKTTLDTDVECSPQAEILGTAGLEDH